MIHFKQFLTEAELFDISKRKDFVIQKYHEFNKKYFDGNLPYDCKFEFKKLNGATAQAVGNFQKVRAPEGYIKRQLIPGSAKIIFNTIYKYTEEKLAGLLLHEMIHLKNYVNGHVNNMKGQLGWFAAHGPKFEEDRKRIEKESGISIPLKDEEENEFSKERKVKCVLIYTKERPHNPSYFFISPNAIITIDIVETRIKRIYSRPILKIEIWEGTTGFANVVSVMRNFESRLQTHYFPDVANYDKLKSNMKLIDEKEYGN